MVYVISIINVQGGNGATTTAVALAETLSGEFRKRVLVIDLDPLANATIRLIGEDKCRKLNDSGRTLAWLFKDALEPNNEPFDLDVALQKGVSDVSTARTIDLLPSSPDLMVVQDQLASTAIGRFYSINPIEILWRAVKPKLDYYDLVIVDHPPNLGVITLNGLRLSQGYIIPTNPESTYSIPYAITRMRESSQELAEPIEPLGIVITQYRARSTTHMDERRRLKGDEDAGKRPHVFGAVIRQSAAIASAAKHLEHERTLKEKYPRGLADSYRRLGQDIMTKLAI